MPRSPRALLALVVALALLVAVVPAARADSQIHIVQAGETLFRISQQYGVSIQAIQSANGIVGSRIYAGQQLVIPDLNAPVIQPASQNSGSVIHVVQRGETLFTIGLKYNLRWTAIQSANSLTSERIYAGQRLVIPVSGVTAAPLSTPEPVVENPTAPTPDPAANTTVTEAAATQAPAGNYTVQRGDTLAKIGQKYSVDWRAIQAANGIVGDRIYVGQLLVIPAAGSAPLQPAVESAPPAPAGGGKRFLVDLSEQRLYAYEGDTLVRTTLISSGIARYPTVTGTFYVYLRYTSARMRGPGYDLPNVPYVMYFYKGYGLHGTYWHNNFGTPMSHGCVNMPTDEAKWAYYWSDYGTPVTVQP